LLSKTAQFAGDMPRITNEFTYSLLTIAFFHRVAK